MEKGITHVGLDAHKDSIVGAALAPGILKATEWRIPNEAHALRRVARKLVREAPGPVACCYEAGPCGYSLQRLLKAEGVECVVVAPSLIPRKPGDRIKTDRRDARKLAELFRAGLLTEVHPPTEAEEAMRDLCRCREDAKKDQIRHRHQLSKFLMRHGRVYAGKSAWTRAHHQWLSDLRFADEAAQVTFDDYLVAEAHCEERLKALDTKLEEFAGREPCREAVAWLRCFRGIDLVTAMTIVTELHDFRRFHTARELMAYLGMVPSEFSSGEKVRRGSITRAGNGHVRRILVEAAWTYRHRATIGATIRARRKGQPGWVVSLADRANARLTRRYWRLVNTGKHKNVVTTAIARELVGFLWAVLHQRASEVPTAA